MLYLLAGWSLIVPLGIGEGEPMHVNFELILWLLTVPVAASLCVVYDAAPASRVLRAGFAVAVLVSTLAMMAVLNSRPPGDGGLPLERDYSVSAEARFRDAVKAIIPDGNCFAYGRRYVLYTIVDGEFPPDFTIAATGCPQLNGTRWRGNLGDNRPESLAMSPAIAVPAGEPFRVVAFTPCAAPETPAHVAATVSGKTVQLSWSAVSGAEMYQIEVGSKPGWTDQGTLRSSAPGLEFPNVAAGLYFTRVRAGNRCGKGGASDEIQVRVN